MLHRHLVFSSVMGVQQTDTIIADGVYLYVYRASMYGHKSHIAE